MNSELSVVKAFLKYSVWNEYNTYITAKDFPEDLQFLYRCLDSFHKTNEECVDLHVLDLSNLFFSQHKKDKEFYEGVFDTLLTYEPNEGTIKQLLESIRRAKLLRELSIASYEVAEGKSPYSSLEKLLGALNSPIEDTGVDQDEFVSNDLEDLLSKTYGEGGLSFRLLALRRMLGPLRKGNFGFIFARPESFSRDTEVLTPTGWLRVDQVTSNTYISQVNADLSVSFVRPTAIHPHEQTHCYHIHDELGRVDLIVTQGHGMIYEKEGNLYKERADQVKYKQGIKHHVAATSSVPKDVVDFLPEHRLLIAYQADGHTRNYKEYGYTFSFKKERKQNRLKEILSQCGYEYTEYKDGNRGHLGYYVKSKIRLVKDFSWVNLALVSKEWCQQFIEELSYWDATRRTDCRFKYDTVDFDVASKVQAIAILAGYNCLLSKHIDERSPNYSDIYSLSIRTNYQPVDGQSIKKELIPFSDTTYCFEVPSGMLLVRRNGAVAVSGNTGKTTFLASEITYMAEQLVEGDGPILWCNNEQVDDEVFLRVYQAGLGITIEQLLSNKPHWQAEFKKKFGNKILMPRNFVSTKQNVERLIKKYKPSLVVFDQIDKIKGFDADREDLLLGSIYQWARELAKQQCPIIAVCQADGSGEGQKWLTMANVANAKTAKQAEADWILGIGKTHDVGWESIRFLHLSKNKLMGDANTDPSLRHGKVEVVIKPEIGRYEDLT